jgi:hypothetical protein
MFTFDVREGFLDANGKSIWEVMLEREGEKAKRATTAAAPQATCSREVTDPALPVCAPGNGTDCMVEESSQVADE